jgi:uncharacterized protein YebE (UPF0316 family)
MRMVDVTLGTIRMIIIVRGRPFIAAMIGFVEVTIFIVAISAVISHLDNWYNVFGYSGGFAAGTFIGVMLERRIAPGYANVRVVSKKRGRLLAFYLGKNGFGVTEMEGHGIYGEVHIINTLVRRRQAREVIDLVKSVDPDAFVTMEESRSHYRGFFRAKRK